MIFLILIGITICIWIVDYIFFIPKYEVGDWVRQWVHPEYPELGMRGNFYQVKAIRSMTYLLQSNETGEEPMIMSTIYVDEYYKKVDR
jgi:hypothetical protein